MCILIYIKLYKHMYYLHISMLLFTKCIYFQDEKYFKVSIQLLYCDYIREESNLYKYSLKAFQKFLMAQFLASPIVS